MRGLPCSTHMAIYMGWHALHWYKLVFVALLNTHTSALSRCRWPRQPLCNFLLQEHSHVRRIITTAGNGMATDSNLKLKI